MDKNLKIKPLSKAQILISLDRLTRFKPPEEKYFRVFSEIICSNLISPKFKKQDLNSLPYKELTKLAEKIFEISFSTLGFSQNEDFLINKKLLDYEKSVFIFDKQTEALLDNKINYKAAINLLKDENISLNLKWLKVLAEGRNQIKERKASRLRFPVEKVILVEGITEEILLPEFAKISGSDFDKAGIYLISAGGKNQVVKLFYKYADILKIPIFVLLDNDAKENYLEIKAKLRKNDEIYILKKGEFEDLLPLGLIKRSLNRHFKNFYSVTFNDLKGDSRMTKILELLFKKYNSEFKKAEFANLIRKNIESVSDVSVETKEIINAILKFKEF